MDNEAKSRPFFLLQFLSAEITATISPQVHVEIEKLANKAGAQSLEACMASSITQAREGKLYLMCGGNEDAFRKGEPILKEVAAQIRFVGRAGEAAKVKALVNMVMNINTAGLAEGLGLGAALGLDLTMLREVFSQTGANSRVLETERRRHAKPRAQLLFLRGARSQRQRHRSRTRRQPWPQPTARPHNEGTI
jgi:3-hydroxyisobutyrate dehydrogenase-like beta-hydroxyacid dehydrogenase